MSGLRAKHKADRNDRILTAAADLFREHGYDPVKIETIAMVAEVSVGTIYNYYQNKGDLLVAIVAMEVNEVLMAGAKLVAKPPRSAEKAVNALIDIYISHSLYYLSKAMWRQAMAITTLQSDSHFGNSYANLDRAICQQISALIVKLQELNLIQQNVDARSLGEIIFNNNNNAFIEFIKDDAMETADLLNRLHGHHRIMVNAFKP
jgi:AcrR family transcriptional regulator